MRAISIRTERKCFCKDANDSYAGDMFPGELMEKASEVGSELILKYSNSLKEIIEKAEIFIENNNWECDEDREEFLESVIRLQKMVD